MSTIRVRTNAWLGSVSTSRYFTIQTSPATQFVLTSGAQALTIFNVGSGALIWGDSNIAVNSGTYLYPATPKSWENLQDAWTVYFRADSVATLIAATEYGV